MNLKTFSPFSDVCLPVRNLLNLSKVRKRPTVEESGEWKQLETKQPSLVYWRKMITSTRQITTIQCSFPRHLSRTSWSWHQHTSFIILSNHKFLPSYCIHYWVLGCTIYYTYILLRTLLGTILKYKKNDFNNFQPTNNKKHNTLNRKKIKPPVRKCPETFSWKRAVGAKKGSVERWPLLARTTETCPPGFFWL